MNNLIQSVAHLERSVEIMERLEEHARDCGYEDLGNALALAIAALNDALHLITPF